VTSVRGSLVLRHGLVMVVLQLALTGAMLVGAAEADEARALPASAEARAAERDPVGVHAAHRRLGRHVPVGRDVVIGQIEGEPQRYMPNWNDQRFGRVTFIRRSGESEVFGHATQTAREMLGPNGLAPGVRVAHFFAANHWMDRYLRVNSAEPPIDDLPRVLNHSWIGPAVPGVEQVLARVDYQIDRRGVVMCVGVNNGRGSAVPAMLASAHNVISVGVASGNSSGGETTVAGEGRSKPEVVAPRNLTSTATPVVTAIVARLLEAADRMPEAYRARAQRPEVIKAALMAGAVKPAGWAPEEGRPMDRHLGAGVVHLDRSLRVLEATPSEPDGQASPNAGWDYRSLQRGGRAVYRFELDEPISDVSVLLTWHRRVTGVVVQHPQERRPVWAGLPRTANFNLRLVRITDAGVETVASSASAVDNVELVHVVELTPGRYAIEVTRTHDEHADDWAYAVAWRSDAGPAQAAETREPDDGGEADTADTADAADDEPDDEPDVEPDAEPDAER
jgi:hypothetical protein